MTKVASPRRLHQARRETIQTKLPVKDTTTAGVATTTRKMETAMAGTVLATTVEVVVTSTTTSRAVTEAVAVAAATVEEATTNRSSARTETRRIKIQIRTCNKSKVVEAKTPIAATRVTRDQTAANMTETAMTVEVAVLKAIRLGLAKWLPLTATQSESTQQMPMRMVQSAHTRHLKDSMDRTTAPILRACQ